MKVLGIYTRVSTDEQVRRGNSLSTQRKRGIELSEEIEWDYKIYEDKGISGKTEYKDLPSLSKMIKDIKGDKIHGVSIIEFSRLIRNDDNWSEIQKLFKKYNTQLYIDGKFIDLNDPDVKLIIDIQKSLNIHEVERLSKRIKKGLLTGIEKGRVGGGSTQPYGFIKGEDKQLTIDKEQSEIIKLIYQKYIEGMGTKSISTYLNDNNIPTKYTVDKLTLTHNGKKLKKFIWKDGTIYRILTNPLYKGDRMYKGQIYKVEPIVSEDMWELVQQQRKNKNHFKNTTNKHFYLLKGLLICGECNNSMSGMVKTNRGMRVYRCNTKRGHITHNCNSRGINIDKLNNYVIKEIIKLPQQIERYFEFQSRVQGIETKINTLNSLNQQIIKNLELTDQSFELNIDKTTKENRINKLVKELKVLEGKRNLIKKEIEVFEKKDDLIRDVQSIVQPLIDGLNNKVLTNEVLTNIVRSFVEVKGIEVSYIDKKDKRPYHLIIIQFKIDNLTNIILNSEFQIDTYTYKMLKNKLSFISIGEGEGEGVNGEVLNSGLPIKIDIE